MTKLEMAFEKDGSFELKEFDSYPSLVREALYEWGSGNEYNWKERAILLYRFFKNYFGIEKEKYKWHDLRENPNDLPKDGEWILFYTKEFDDEYELRYWTGKFRKSGFRKPYFCKDDVYAYITVSSYEVEEVIAWRRIETFDDTERSTDGFGSSGK